MWNRNVESWGCVIMTFNIAIVEDLKSKIFLENWTEVKTISVGKIGNKFFLSFKMNQLRFQHFMKVRSFLKSIHNHVFLIWFCIENQTKSFYCISSTSINENAIIIENLGFQFTLTDLPLHVWIHWLWSLQQKIKSM